MKRFAVILLFLGACACSPKIIEKVRTEYVYRDRVERDTTFLHDSTYIREYVKGDTVRITEYRDRYLYRDRWKERTDTVAVHDTTRVEVVKKVEKPLTGWQKFRMNGFWVLLTIFVATGIWLFRKRL